MEVPERLEFDEKAQKVFEDEAGPATSQRLSSTDLQGYDEIIAISEESLNSILRLRFNDNTKKKKNKRLRVFQHAVPGYGDIDAKLAAPHIRMVVDGGPQAVQFFVNFESGKFDYWVGQGRGAESRDQDLTDWKIAFNVSFSLEKLGKVPEAIREKITLMKPGAYSVSQIILGLSAAQLVKDIDWNASAYPGISKQEDVAVNIRDAFKKYFEVYLDWLSKGSYSVLGYSIKVVDKPAENSILERPSFPPTAVECLTQAYVPHNEDFQKEFPKTSSFTKPTRAGLDSLIFLEMTEHRGWPGTHYDSAKSGNWITGSVDASLALSSRVFWKFLVDKFSVVNMQTLALANDVYHWSNFSSQQNNDHPWRITKDSKPTTAPWQSTAEGANYAWVGEIKEGPGTTHDYLTTKINNSIKWTPGSDAVKVSVAIEIVRDVAAPSMAGGGSSYVKTTTLTWSLTLRLNTIKAGELETAISSETPKLQQKRDDSTSFWDWGGKIEKREEAAVKTITENMNISGIQKQITDVLNGKGSKFIFPGAGDFAMRDPTFNQKGDLLVTLKLNAGSLVIDNDFHLQVTASGHPNDGQWIKVANAGDEAGWLLVSDKEQATLFQIDNGKLVVDIDGFPIGQQASAKPEEASSASDPTRKVRDVFFDTPEMATKRKPKLDCYVTGSGFFYSTEPNNPKETRDWWTRFIVEDQKVRLWPNNPPKEDAQLAVIPFILQAVY